MGIRQPRMEWHDRQLDREVEVALDGLPREYRDAVVLCDVEGYAYGEIAQMLGVAGGTIKSRIHRGRQQLRGALRGYALEVGYLRAGVNG